MDTAVPTWALQLPEIKGEGFLIRPFTSEDAPSLASALNDKAVTERLTNIPYPYEFWDATRWIASTTQVVTMDSTRVNFAIIVDGRVAGSVSFIDLKMQQNNAQISVWVARRFWKQGLATKALESLIAFGFVQMELYRVFAFCVADNEKSQKMLTRLGFTQEGVHRLEWKKEVDGAERRFDSLHFSLLHPEWEERTAACS